MTTKMQRARASAAVLTAAFIGGCATAFPADQLASSEAAIAMARQSGATEEASLELGLARQKLELGKRFIAVNDLKPARWLVEQARVDAELAAMKAASARALRGAALLTAELRARNSTVAFLGKAQ